MKGIVEIRKVSEHNNNQLVREKGGKHGARKAALTLDGCVVMVFLRTTCAEQRKAAH